MARPLRIEYEGALYHITARGNERRKIYFAESDYEKFKQYIVEAKEKHDCIIHCYVLMGNHYHLIIETSRANLSRVMHFINGAYTTYINVKRKRSGHLFQGRYKAIVIDADSYLLELSRYIHLNPVRAGIVENPGEYPYSSYKSYITKNKESMITRDLILEMLSKQKGGVKKRYRAYVESVLGEELENPLKNIYGGMMLGSNIFIKNILGRIKEDYLQKEEVSHRRALKASLGIDETVEFVSEYFKISKDDILRSESGEARKIAIYLIKRHTAVTNRQIGELFGDISYSAVAKAYQRFKKQLEKDKALRRKIVKIEKEMSYVKG